MMKIMNPEGGSPIPTASATAIPPLSSMPSPEGLPPSGVENTMPKTEATIKVEHTIKSTTERGGVFFEARSPEFEEKHKETYALESEITKAQNNKTESEYQSDSEGFDTYKVKVEQTQPDGSIKTVEQTRDAGAIYPGLINALREIAADKNSPNAKKAAAEVAILEEYTVVKTPDSEPKSFTDWEKEGGNKENARFKAKTGDRVEQQDNSTTSSEPPKNPEEIKKAGYARAKESRKKYVAWRNVRNGEIVLDPTNREMNEYWIKQVDRQVLNNLDISNIDDASEIQVLNIDRTHNQRLIQLDHQIQQNPQLKERYKNNPNIQAAIAAAIADEAFMDQFYESIEEKFDKTSVEAEFINGKLSRENEQKIFLDTFDTLQKEAADIEKQSDKIENDKLFKVRNIQFTKSGMMAAGKNLAFAMGIATYLLYQDAESQEKQGQSRMGH